MLTIMMDVDYHHTIIIDNRFESLIIKNIIIIA